MPASLSQRLSRNSLSLRTPSHHRTSSTPPLNTLAPQAPAPPPKCPPLKSPPPRPPPLPPRSSRYAPTRKRLGKVLSMRLLTVPSAVGEPAYVSVRQRTSAYVSIRQHIRQRTSAYVSVRQHTSCGSSARGSPITCMHTSAYVSIRQHTSAYVSIRQHTPAYASIRQNTPAYVSIRQHTSAYASIRQHTSAYVMREQREGLACAARCTEVN
jgi:hypothetical protein